MATKGYTTICSKQAQKLASAQAALVCDTAPVPEVLHSSVDVTNLSVQHRCGFLHSPKTTLTRHNIGGETVLRIPVGDTFTQFVLIYQAPMKLGMKQHVQHIATRIAITFTNTVVEYSDLTIFLLCFPISDPLFQHAAITLADHRYQGRVPDKDDFKAYLQQHPKLREAMDAFDDPLKVARTDRKEKRFLTLGSRRICSLPRLTP
ncbi:hypothetical protein K458DRAFT_471490 [Lentithecium fluviatile CBS 122367]|uniref:Uncharacterized protein n=1 Tax=Lentithecium fluviatile CBS 122367 TaxID=1168545 RepID=A0A6G1J6P5_9PLEO|nr:hypothetical protein K458DRAFT_471490 [Lentithecium fluviatile CBS 122367]